MQSAPHEELVQGSRTFHLSSLDYWDLAGLWMIDPPSRSFTEIFSLST